MSGVRIRWSWVGRAAMVALAGLVAVQALPGLLRPPDPPPLAADVGLPQVQEKAIAEPRVGPARVVATPPRPKPRPPKPPPIPAPPPPLPTPEPAPPPPTPVPPAPEDGSVEFAPH